MGVAIMGQAIEYSYVSSGSIQRAPLYGVDLVH